MELSAMSKTLFERVVIINPNDSDIVPQFGDAAVANRITQALDRLGIEVDNLYYDNFPDLSEKICTLNSQTIVMPNGMHVESDSSAPLMVSVLDAYGLAYIGSDASGMATLSKIWMKIALRAHDIPTLPYVVFPGSGAARFVATAGQSFVLKPEFGANSEGVTHVESTEMLAAASSLHDKNAERVLIEPWAREGEYTVAVLQSASGQLVTVPLKIVLAEGDSFLSREVKLLRVAETHRRVTDQQRHAELCKLAAKAFHACHLRDLARIDILESQTGELVVIDVNPHPGFKPGPHRPSYYPAAFEFEYNWSYEDLILCLIGNCAERTRMDLPPHLSEQLSMLSSPTPT